MDGETKLRLKQLEDARWKLNRIADICGNALDTNIMYGRGKDDEAFQQILELIHD